VDAAVNLSLPEQLMLEPLGVRAGFVASDAKLHAEITRQTGTPWFIWQDSPVDFVEHVLGESTWEGQREILQSAWDHERTAVAACHAPGKTHIAARIVAWWIATHPFGTAQAVTTAPTWRQVKNLLWPHIRRLHSLHGFPGRIGENAEWKVGDDLAAFGFSPSDYDEAAAQGIHAPYILVVVDEAGGISKIRFQSMEGMMSAGFARMVAIGNPATDDENTAFEERYNAAQWNSIRIPAWRTPNFTDEETGPCSCAISRFQPHRVARHLTTPEWVDAKFPHGLTERTIPMSFIERAMERDMPMVPSSTAALGVDVASDGGDELAFAVARGWAVEFLEGRAGEQNADALQVAFRVRQHIEGTDVPWEGLIAAQKRLDGSRRAVCRIDAIGLGWGVYGVVRAWASEFMWPVDIVAVQVGEKPDSRKAQERFLNKRAEMWWGMRDRLRDTVKLRCDKRTVAQLAGPTYDITSSGLIKIESKDDMRRRGLPSPDRAEACLLAAYIEASAPPAVASGERTIETRLPGVRRRN
jgi:hypothetical protein